MTAREQQPLLMHSGDYRDDSSDLENEEIRPAVQDQPTQSIRNIQYVPRYKYGRGQHYLILSVVMTFLCCVCGAWWSLICTIPAIFYSITAKDAEADGNHERAEQAVLTAVQLNLFAIVFYFLSLVILALVLIVHFSLVDDHIPSK